MTTGLAGAPAGEKAQIVQTGVNLNVKVRDIKAWNPGSFEYGVKQIASNNLVKLHPQKWWFLEQLGWTPHIWQFLSMFETDEKGHIYRYRHAVAGRRGGKTNWAAVELVFYCLYPAAYWFDFHGEKKTKPLKAWVTSHMATGPGRAAEQEVLEVLNMLGLKMGERFDYTYNKTQRFIQFSNGSYVEFHTGSRPDRHTSKGINYWWLDEYALLDNDDTYMTGAAALIDGQGVCVFTTTPRGRNFYYERWFDDEVLATQPTLSKNILRIQWWTEHNPHLREEEIDLIREQLPPAFAEQELRASFDSMAGLALNTNWLFSYVDGDDSEGYSDVPRTKDGRYDPMKMELVIGVDPSTGTGYDEFVMTLVGIRLADGQMLFLRQEGWGLLPFPEQLEVIQRWAREYIPQGLKIIAIEAGGPQKVLAETVMRLDHMPMILPVTGGGSKEYRFSMLGPIAKNKRILFPPRIAGGFRGDMVQFAKQWTAHDPAKVDHQKNDRLDSFDIAVRAANPTTRQMLQFGVEPQRQDGRPPVQLGWIRPPDVTKAWNQGREHMPTDEARRLADLDSMASFWEL